MNDTPLEECGISADDSDAHFQSHEGVSYPDGASHCSESATEYNTGDLSDLSGLSKILKADDSIADRVRCLLEDGENSVQHDRPVLLSAADDEVETTRHLNDRMLSLLGDSGRTSKQTCSANGKPEGVLRNGIPLLDDEKLPELVQPNAHQGGHSERLSSTLVGQDESPPPSICLDTPRDETDNRPSLGGHPEPSQTQRESYDDIMNLSDTTEYSDLPKVVDNPMKKHGLEKMNHGTARLPTKNGTASSSKVQEDADPSEKITGKAGFYTDSDPNTPHFEERGEKLLELQKYVQGLAVGPTRVKSDPEPIQSGNGVPSVKGPVHSTPSAVIHPKDDSNLDRSSTQEANSPVTTCDLTPLGNENFHSPRKIAWEERFPSDQNITIRSRMSNSSRAKSSLEPPHSVPSTATTTPDISQNLREVDQSGRVKEERGFDSGRNSAYSLKGRHTASEHSLASTVDSLAMQVKSLLQERDSLLNQISSGDLTESFAQNTTQNSNYSEEISNFEKTSLWKYTRQFLPGALTPTREIRPLAMFKKPAVPQKSETSMNRSVSDSGVNDPLRNVKEREMSVMSHSGSYQDAGLLYTKKDNNFVPPPESIQRHASPAVSGIAYNPLPPPPRYSLDRPSNFPSQSGIGDSDMHHGRLADNYYRFGPPIKYTTPNSPQRIVGRYDSHMREEATVTPFNESYKPLAPEKSQTPFTPHSFITPKRSDPTPDRSTPSSKVTDAKESRKGVNLYKANPKAFDSEQKEPLKSSYFGGDVNPKTGMKNSHGLVSKDLAQGPIKSAYFGEDTSSRDSVEKRFAPPSSEHVSALLRYRTRFQSELERKHFPHGEKLSMRTGDPRLPPTNPRADDSMASSAILISNYSPDPSPRQVTQGITVALTRRHSPGPCHSSPKSVRFKEPDEMVPCTIPSKSALRPEYSFTTPKVSCRPARSVTPKVVKNRPRSARVLPTFDQLVVEQERSKDDADVPGEKSSKFVLHDEMESAHRGMVTDETPIMHLRESERKNKILSSIKNEQSVDEFSALKPEICFDDSCQDMAVRSLDNSPEQSSAYTSERDLNSASPDMSKSDTELHRRGTSPLRSSDGAGLSVEQTIPSSEMKYRWPERTDMVEATSGDVDNKRPKKQPVSTPRPGRQRADMLRSSSTESTSPPNSVEQETAPTPYIRTKKRAHAVPPRNSISTEKVQNLLMKEKGAAGKQEGQRSVGINASLRGGRGESSSSDEDLRSLLQTFSAKAPMMEKLLRKLYERSLQKKSKHGSVASEDTQLGDQRQLVDQSVQTLLSTAKKTSVLKTAATNVPSVAKTRSTQKRKVLVSSTSQTSPTLPEDSNCSPGGSSAERDTQEKNRTPLQSRARTGDKGNQYCDSFHHEDRGNVKKLRKDEDKENIQRKKKESHAFFVDFTPEKMPPRTDMDSKAKHSPVAWYEPYEYMPPWKQQTKEEEPKLGFVRVNIQDAFLSKKREFVIRSWERQEDIAIRAEERKLKDLEKKIHQQITSLHRERVVTMVKETREPPSADQQGYQRRGDTTWREMRMASKKKYESLPEVVAKKRDAERKKYYELNRIRAVHYKDKITRVVVQKQKSKKTAQVR